MKDIVINDKTISIPESWEEVLIKNQLAFEKLSIEHPDFKSLAIIAGYCNLSLEEVKRLPLNNVKKILDHLSFTATKIENKSITEFEYKNEKYSLIATMLKGETQDFISLETLLENYKGKEYLALPYIVAILSKKTKADGKFESLDEFDLDARAKHFEDLPITIANSIYWFFFVTAAMYSIDSHQLLKSLDQEINQSINYCLTIPKRQNGGGLFTRLQKAILRSYLKFLQRSWRQYYTGFNSERENKN